MQNYMVKNKKISFPKDIYDPEKIEEACKDYLRSYEMAEMRNQVREWVDKKMHRTAWRVEGTLREFASFDPINIWFDYPIHTLDDGLLKDNNAQGSESAADRKADGNKRGLKKLNNYNAEVKKQNLSKLDIAYADLLMEKQEVSVKDMAEYMDKSYANMRNTLNRSGNYVIKDGYVYAADEEE